MMRGAVNIAAALLCLAGGALALVRGAQERSLLSRLPDGASAPRSRDWRGASRDAAQAIERGALDDAKRDAARAVNAMPMRPEPLTQLALIAQQQGQYQRAGELTSAIGLLGWRYPGAQLLILESGRQQGNAQAAILRADALLRQGGAPREALFPLLRQLARKSDALAALVDRLGADPAWRAAFMQELKTLQPAGYPVQSAVLNGLRSTEAPPKPLEIARFSDRLIKSGHFADAERLGHALAGPRRSSAALDTGSPFDWVSGTTSGITVAALADGRGIVVSTEGSVTGVAARRLMLVSPGPHRLRAQIDGNARMLRWGLECATKAKLTLGMPPVMEHSTAVDIPFTAPEGCGAVRINLIIAQLGADTSEITIRNANLD
jgi:hypothetical protein